MKVYFYSLNSCGMRNTVIQSYRDYLIANGHEVVNHLADSEAVLLWTCAFRRDMRDNSLTEIKHLEESYPGKLIVAGCLPDIDRGILTRITSIILPWRGDQQAWETIFGKAPRN
jgi:tRNA A37 methylthiotransferase MiaB